MTAATPASAPWPEASALADLARRERFFDTLGQSLATQQCVKLVLAKPRAGAADLVRVTARPLRVRDEDCLQLVYSHKTRDITKNPPQADALAALRELMDTSFSHAHLFTTTEEWQLTISKRGKVGLVRHNRDAGTADTPVAPAAHDRAKKRALSLQCPFLEDLGITDERHRLVPAMARKWKQINKFLEVMEPALERAALGERAGQPIRVLDFGAGKGYLTFATYHHLAVTHGWPTEVTGVELRQDLVDLCNSAAARRSMSGLHFECGDVRTHASRPLDVMIALHACDTATDIALAAGIRGGAAVIVSSPCCHKQLRPQMQLPPVLKGMLEHGIHLGQQAEMVTDSLRALLLESRGYDAQVFEFIALEHTSKNKMILAVRRAADAPGEARRREQALAKVADIKAFYGITEQALEQALRNGSDVAQTGGDVPASGCF